MDQQTYHLVHANVAHLLAPLDDPSMADFVRRVDDIDARAKSMPGYVSQPAPQDEGQVFSGRALLNLSIWESVESLDAFTHGGLHAQALERRAEWFEQQVGPSYVLYWAPAGHHPTEEEVAHRLAHLADHGSTPFAFTFDQRYTVEQALEFMRK